jgi:hypothetical protein
MACDIFFVISFSSVKGRLRLQCWLHAYVCMPNILNCKLLKMKIFNFETLLSKVIVFSLTFLCIQLKFVICFRVILRNRVERWTQSYRIQNQCFYGFLATNIASVMVHRTIYINDNMSKLERLYACKRMHVNFLPLIDARMNK